MEKNVIHDEPVVLTVEIAKYYGRRLVVELANSDPEAWAIRGDGLCFNKVTLEWNYEPSSSRRTDKWLAEHRFPTFEEACVVARLEAHRDMAAIADQIAQEAARKAEKA